MSDPEVFAEVPATDVPATGTVDPAPEGTEDTAIDTRPVYEQALAIAIIVDDEVVDILYTNDVLAAAFTSQPKFRDVSLLMADPLLHPGRGWAFEEETNSFIGRNANDEPVSLSL